MPHSGPFARGIHVTVQAVLKKPPVERATRKAALREFYRGGPFVRVLDTAPRIKDVAASNYAHLSAVTNGSLHRGDVGARQSEQGRRRRRACNG